MVIRKLLSICWGAWCDHLTCDTGPGSGQWSVQAADQITAGCFDNKLEMDKHFICKLADNAEYFSQQQLFYRAVFIYSFFNQSRINCLMYNPFIMIFTSTTFIQGSLFDSFTHSVWFLDQQLLYRKVYSIHLPIQESFACSFMYFFHFHQFKNQSLSLY